MDRDYLSEQLVKDWALTHCKSKEAIEKELNDAKEETKSIIEYIEEIGVSSEPITFYAKDFKGERSFAYALFNVAAYYKNSNDVIVRYAKPENKETKEILTCFQVLKSKAKIFDKYVDGLSEPINFLVSSNKEIKDAIKFFNSLGVKDENGNGLLMKGSDLSDAIKNALKQNENKIYMEIKKSKEVNEVVLDWYPVDIDFNAKDYDTAKIEVKSIF